MQPFKFCWEDFNISGGLKYLLGLWLISLLSGWLGFPWMVAGISAVLAWIMIILGKGGNESVLAVTYLVLGLALTWISGVLSDSYWSWLFFVFAVTFMGTLLVRFGTHWFMLGWCLIYWFLLTPVMASAAGPDELLLSHLLGSGCVLLLVLIEALWIRVSGSGRTKDNCPQAAPEAVPWGLAIPHALTIASVVAVGLALGQRYLSTDPTLIANAAFMIIGFSMINTLKAGLERMIAAVLAIVLGFYLGALVQSGAFGIAFTIVMSFFVLAFLEVNNGAVIFFFLISMGYGWGLMDFEAGNAMANERLVAEFAGIVLAGVAVSALNFILKLGKAEMPVDSNSEARHG